MTLLMVRWRTLGSRYCVNVIGCNVFIIIKRILLIIIYREQNIPTFKTINDFNVRRGIKKFVH